MSNPLNLIVGVARKTDQCLVLFNQYVRTTLENVPLHLSFIIFKAGLMSKLRAAVYLQTGSFIVTLTSCVFP